MLAQHTACNRRHPIVQRCARWLLMTHDRVETDQFQLTQEFLAQMLCECYTIIRAEYDRMLD